MLIGIDYLSGKLWVDEFVTHHQDLENINKGFDDMHVSTLVLFPSLPHSSPRLPSTFFSLLSSLFPAPTV